MVVCELVFNSSALCFQIPGLILEPPGFTVVCCDLGSSMVGVSLPPKKRWARQNHAWSEGPLFGSEGDSRSLSLDRWIRAAGPRGRLEGAGCSLWPSPATCGSECSWLKMWHAPDSSPKRCVCLCLFLLFFDLCFFVARKLESVLYALRTFTRFSRGRGEDGKTWKYCRKAP